MPYLGNSPASNFASVTKDTFSGDGSTTAFTLSKTATTNGVAVYVENVRQIPTTAYTVSGTTLDFGSGNAPVSGTNNIYVLHHNTPASTATHPSGQNLLAVDGTFSGDVSVGDDLTVTDDILLSSDSAAIKFGADSEITLTHRHNDGLVLKHTGTGSGSRPALAFHAGETEITSGDVLGKIEFQAPDEASGTDAALIGAEIRAVAEDTFSASSNETRLEFRTGNSESATTKMSIDGDGNVGIGTTTPSQLLNLQASTNPVIEISTLSDSNPTDASALDIVEKQSSASSTATFGQNGVYGFRTILNGSDNTLRIKSGSQTTVNDRVIIARDTGNIGIGVSPESAVKFEIDAGSDGAVAISGRSDGGNGNNRRFNINAISSGGTYGGGFILETRNSSNTFSEAMRFDFGGAMFLQNVYDDTTSFGANMYIHTDGVHQVLRSTSSERYKKDIETLEDKYADAVLGLRPVWYKSKCEADNPDYSHWGLIAEEVAKVDPRLVTFRTEITKRYRDKETEEEVVETTKLDEPQAESVQYDRFVPHLLNICKRQEDKITALEARIKSLEEA